MGGAVFHRDRGFAPVARTTRVKERRLPPGYGLLIGAGMSLGLWAAIGFAVVSVFS